MARRAPDARCACQGGTSRNAKASRALGDDRRQGGHLEADPHQGAGSDWSHIAGSAIAHSAPQEVSQPRFTRLPAEATRVVKNPASEGHEDSRKTKLLPVASGTGFRCPGFLPAGRLTIQSKFLPGSFRPAPPQSPSELLPTRPQAGRKEPGRNV